MFPMRSWGSPKAFQLRIPPTDQRSPPHAARHALEWSRKVGRDPPAIEAAGLRCRLSTVYRASVERTGIESDVIAQDGEGRVGSG